MVLKVNITISPADLTDLYVINDDLPLRIVKRLSDYEVSGNVLTGSVEARYATDTIKIISSGYVEQILTFSDIQTNPDIVLVSSNEAENLSNGTNTYPLADKTARDIIDSLDSVAFNGVIVDQTYDSTSANAQSGTAVAGAISNKADKATTLSGYGITDGADTDLSNLTSTGKSYASGLGMPSSKYDDLTLGASGTSYTAPANGWVLLTKQSTATNQYVEVGKSNNIRMRGNAVSNNSACMAYIAVTKGSSFYVSYTAGGTTNFFRFIYAVGEV